MTPRAIFSTAALLILAGCSGGSDGSGPQSRPDTETRGASLAASRDAASGTCPVTLPNGRKFPAESDPGANHGNGKIWTAFWPYNVLIATPDYIGTNGAVEMKWPWWWRGVKGRLTISGRWLDGEAPPLEAFIPFGYENGFNPSGLSFPTEGCWEVTGRVGDVELTFVTLVLRASRYWPYEENP